MFSIDNLANPRFVSENRMRPHSDHAFYASARECERGDSSLVQCLDGTWQFHLAKNPHEVVDGFAEPAFDTSLWDAIRVPGHIQTQGYDQSQYTNKQYPWDGLFDVNPPQVPTESNPTACYVKDFDLDSQVGPGERVTITFEGAESALAVWLNGQYVGYSEDSFSPSEFDVTELVKPRGNRVAVQVFKWCSGSWLEDQDFFRFSGLFRSVNLRRYPRAHAYDLALSTRLSEDFARATVTLDVEVIGEGSVVAHLDGVGEFSAKPVGGAAKNEHTSSGEPAPDDPESSTEATPARGKRHRLQLEVERPRLWSAEDPHLYKGTLLVRDRAGEPVEVVPLRVGVRRFGIEDGLLKINGERIVFHGVNRHEFCLDGRTITREQTQRDLVTLKRLGVNAIRTSHYPNNSFFYELADEYGFYVMDEVNLETHGLFDMLEYRRLPVSHAVPGDSEDWSAATLDRAASMFERDKNHACVVMWSCGNESYGGKNIFEVGQYLRRVDDRPVHYEGTSIDNRYPDTSDVHSRMYMPAAKVPQFVEENADKPFILAEFAHCMGNSFGAVHLYTDLMRSLPRFQGGFIWDFADQALLAVDRYGNEYMAYGGDHGDAPNDEDFCGNGLFYADRSPKPPVQEAKFVYQKLTGSVERDTFTVSNLYNFTNSSQFICKVTLRDEGTTLQTAVVDTSVSPGETRSYPLPFALPETTVSGECIVDVSFLLKADTAYAEAGFEVANLEAVFPTSRSATFGACAGGLTDAAVSTISNRAPEPADGITSVSADAPASCGLEVREAPRVITGIHNIGVSGPSFSALFSRTTQGMTSYKFGEVPGSMRELLRTSPKPNFWHAPTSNERGWHSSFDDAVWAMASAWPRLEDQSMDIEAHVDGQFVVISYDYRIPTPPTESTCTVCYRIGLDGTVHVDEHLDCDSSLPDLPEFGMLLTVDSDLDQIRFYGAGPDETYSDRCLGARLGVYESDTQSGFARYLRPQECGNHVGVRWAEVFSEDGFGVRLQADTPMEFSALPWGPFQVEQARHPNELPQPLYTHIRPALARRGVGGDNSWGAETLPQYRIPAGPMDFKFSFKGIDRR
ncbi:glycoside hydrolase family 2 TIM barrel-domain containing protein [Gleimia hominis]|uniref:glycoside hydrolase family 2 TIM barrel-domain containing protein n=1 Tax=Gleimia hominis TaxID=595468 RepID=UPI0025428542|nr:glycoside hydrolase family 2 TIM barrel-domain containing protein [Gleimia hominis]WIK64711.1 glycoside hydrolase family 2 TIM barrel-domain containing protein [Gleimia hominis]